MYFNRFIAIFGRLVGRAWGTALCPVRVRTWVRRFVIVAALLSARTAQASVLATGDFSPADNPFTLNFNEGMPTDGNFVNPFELANHQTFFEGRHTDGVNTVDPADDTNINFDIKVGITSSGTLLISGESALRDMNLIIGDRGTLNGNTRLGSGVVRITGFGSLYNNDFNILPAEVQNVSGFSSQKPRSSESGAADGFNLWVGRWGSGTLEISAGARAEIQDSAAIGDNAGAVGNVIVDGFDSFLGSGGFQGNGPSSATDLHLLSVGRQGTGTMTISTGATVDSEASPVAGGNNQTGPIGAVLGSTPYSLTLGQVPDPGGNGTVTVTGAASKWIVGGSLQVGGFDIGLQGVTVGDVEGDNVQYSSQAGRGTLYVNDGGVVVVRNAIGITPTDTTTSLLLAIGRFGVVQLAGGTINVGNVTGSQNQARPDSVQVINDGVISGSGRINTGVFRNRYLGSVRVDAGQSLVIDSSSQFASAGGATPSEPLVNYGRIEVIGTANAQAQLEFVRASADPTNTSPVRPFFNRVVPRVTPPVPQFGGGLISAQYATLRFGSGIQNESVMAFTAGTNTVSGKVMNIVNDTLDTDGEGDAGESTQILVSGPDTTVVFEDDLGFTANADLNLVNGGNVVVLNMHSFTLAGNLGIELSYAHPSLVTVGGDVGIGQGTSDLTLNFASDVLHSIKHGDAFQLISFGGEIGNVNLTDPNNPVPDLTMAPMFLDVDTSPNITALYGLVPNIQFSNEGVYAVFLNPMLVGGGAGAMGPDFNGDGQVNGADLAIWQAHVGQTGGASVLDGDADGDGDVDGDDFLMWQRNVGKPKPWNGAGSGSGAGGSAAVPEPAGLALLLSGWSLAIAFHRRRFDR